MTSPISPTPVPPPGHTAASATAASADDASAVTGTRDTALPSDPPVTDDTPTVEIIASVDGSDGGSEVDLGRSAAVSHVGLVHRTNEDGFALRTVQPAAHPPDDHDSVDHDRSGGGTITIAAVCDGVSTAPGSGPAAVRAAWEAVELLAHIAGTMSSTSASSASASAASAPSASTMSAPPASAPASPGPCASRGAAASAASAVVDGCVNACQDQDGGGTHPDNGDDDHTGSAPGERDLLGGDTKPLGPRRHPAAGPGGTWQPGALRAAAAAAERGALASVVDRDDTPACTFVAAIVTGEQIAVGWLGDSRAYLLDRSGAHLLTADDTVAAEAVRAGLRPQEWAETGPGSHTITRWIGTSSPGALPHIVGCTPSRPGRLVLCSDGLWNYLSAPNRLAARVDELPASASALAVARHLTSAALAAGGGDNITVVVIDLPADDPR
ncbi:PPM family protein phosphatase [Frankia sp. AiPs1]|uniref:PP2C family protein-serine/threonine phosphatase n=1 Tax=Frankia sp. AiPa1 TaxID=573492 RepID=UPI00202AF622|nr:PP2C family protein-serine/threonine phosphatase [Frankia sp. AiPa1]MCL9760134.1 protein phosphatase 2C domain-containing protein [Frankia sp. AiPa1]